VRYGLGVRVEEPTGPLNYVRRELLQYGIYVAFPEFSEPQVTFDLFPAFPINPLVPSHAPSASARGR
jgi:hypothetical protein